MSIKSISFIFALCAVLLIVGLIALDSYSLKSIVNDSPITNSGNSESDSSTSGMPSSLAADSIDDGSSPQKNENDKNIDFTSDRTQPLSINSSSNIATPSSDNRSVTTNQSSSSSASNSPSITKNDLVDANSATPVSEEPDDNLPIFIAGNISGRAFDDAGKTLANIAITASPYEISPGQSKRAKNTLKTSTNELGEYFFNSVPKASYRICSKKSENYLQACINVLPPQRTADLKITPLSNLVTVSGVVNSDSGEPLKGVSVRVNIAGSQGVKTTENGRYSLNYRSTQSVTPNILFSLKDYVRESKLVGVSNETKPSNIVINATLKAEKESFSVSGKMIDQEGNPVSGQKIQLRSVANPKISSNYASANSQGLFTITKVEPANDYQIRIISSPDYKYVPPEAPQPITVVDNSTSLNLEFEKLYLDYQPMNINLATANQQAISDVTMSLFFKGRTIARKVTDASGSAFFDKVPSSNLSLAVNSLGLRVSGLNREQHNGITLLADKGDHEARISVLGANGQAVFCRRASISINRKQNNLSLNTSRNVQSDEFGVIYATDFGSGEHRLTLSQCEGHQNYNGMINIGNQINFSVRLTPAR